MEATRSFSVFASILLLLLVSSITTKTAEAQGAIYIRADGSIDPPTAPLLKSGDTYYFTDNIADSIIVERSNAVIDAQAFTLQGLGNGTGISIENIDNVTIQNADIKGFTQAIYMADTSRNTIINSTIADNQLGIQIYYASNNTVHNTQITNNTNGIIIYGYSQHNEVLENNICNNLEAGIRFDTGESENLVHRNNITHNLYGIYINFDYNNTIVENNIMHNTYGVGLVWSRGNKFLRNNFINNTIQVTIETANPSEAEAIWDNGYPQGGNYWSDFSGSDQFRGEYQNLTGADGIGDSAYVILESIQDSFPLLAPYPSQDLSIIEMKTTKNVVGEGFNVGVEVTAINQGDMEDDAQIHLYANNTLVNSTSLHMPIREATSIWLGWNTTGFAKGEYVLNVTITLLAKETHVLDNQKTSTVKLTIPGDVNGDYEVNIYDIVKITRIYSLSHDSLLFDPNCDVDGDDEITIVDVVLCTGHYKEEYHPWF